MLKQNNRRRLLALFIVIACFGIIGSSIIFAAGYTSTYTTMNVRGTNNSWGTTAMTLVGNNTWQVDVTFGSTTTERFKFDISNNWATNFGDNNNPQDGIAEQSGADIKITQGAGSYRITFNDSTKAYTIIKIGDFTPPSVSLTAPTAGTTLSGTATVSANAVDNVGVLKVEFYAGTTLIGTDTTSPYSISWATTGVANGTYSLTAKAYDTVSSATSAAISITVNNGFSKVYNTMNVRGTNNSWGTTAMSLVANNTWQVDTTFGSTTDERFKLDISNDWATNFGDSSNPQDGIAEQSGSDIKITQGAGTYKITFNDSTKAYTVVKQGGDTTPPTVSFTAPTNNSTVSGTVTLSANASDNTGSTGMAKVEFYYGSTKIAEDTTSPYSISWNTAAIANGTYTLMAKAYDNASLSASSTVSVTVSNNQLSNNANLSALTLSSGTLSPAFTAATASYTATVANSVASITVTPTVQESHATYIIKKGTTTVTNPVALDVGVNQLSIEVTAQDGTTKKTYSIAVTRSATGLTVHFKLPSGWTGANIYYWGVVPSSVAANTWPGSSMVAEANNWFRYTIGGATSANMVFTDGNGHKTPDLIRDREGWYYTDGKWYDSNPEGLQVNASPAGGPFSTATQVISLSVANGATSGKYTLDGSDPATNGITYTNGAQITIGSDMSVGASKTLRLYATDGVTPVSKSLVFTKTETIVMNTDIDNLMIYQVMVEAFQDGDSTRDYNTGYGPSNHKGDLKGIKNALAYIKSLGCNAIWMTPIFNSNGSSQLDATGYFAQNYFEIDPKFGSLQDAKDLVNEAHRLGMYVFLDGVFGHNKGNVTASPSGYYPSGGNDPVSYPGSLNFYREVATWWIDQLEIDGWRLDQAYQVPVEYWTQIRQAVEAKCQERKNAGKQWGTLGYMVGEIWKGETDIQNQGYGSSTSPGLLSCFDFPLRYSISKVLATQEHMEQANSNRQPASELKNGFNTHSVYASHAHPNLMLTNHDLVRFGDLIQRTYGYGKENADYWKRYKAGISFLAAYTGPITIYYGDEIGDEVSGFINQGDLGLYDDCAARSNGQITNLDSSQQNMKDYVTSLMNLRNSHSALWNGTRTNLRADTSIYMDYKVDGTDKVVYVLNTSTTASTVTIAQSQVGGTKLRNGLDNTTVSAASGNYSVSVPALTGIFLIVE